MTSRLGAIFATGDAVCAWSPQRRAVFGTILVASTAIGFAAVAPFPSSSPSSRAVAAPAPIRLKYQGGAAKAPSVMASARSHSAIHRFSGRVGPNLSLSLATAGVPERQGREYVALLTRAISLADGLSVDDQFDVVLERKDDGTLGQLLYAGLDRVARADVELMKWTDGKRVIWVNADGIGGENDAGLRSPVSGRITSPFGYRLHPILGFTRFHAGVDLGAPAGTPILAAADGRVIRAGWAGGYGRAVEIGHTAGLETRYGHMSRIVAYPGELVRKGDVIGYVGSSGLSTGPHLHFEVTRNGRPVNPLSVSVGGGPGQLEGERLRQFQDELRRLLLVESS